MLDALGIVNIEDNDVKVYGLQDYRPLSAISIFGRYRLIDFILSNYTNSEISEIHVYCKEKPRSLVEHLGTGLHYNINSKKGKLKILFGEDYSSKLYNTDIENFIRNMVYIEECDKEYVVLAPTYMVYRTSFKDVLNSHIESENDISVLYKSVDSAKDEFIGCDCLTFNKDKRIIGIEKNRGRYKSRIISLEAYVMKRELFIQLVKDAAKVSSLYWFKDILNDSLDKYKVGGYSVKNNVSCINNIKAYYDTNMKYCSKAGVGLLRNDSWPIHTMTSDSAPTVYGENSKIKNCIIANGCKIDGTVENCVVGRNVTIKKGAVVKDCVLLHNVTVNEDVTIERIIVDKGAIISNVKELICKEEIPAYVKRRDRI